MANINLGGDGGGAFIRFSAAANAWIIEGEEVPVSQLLLDPSSLRTGWGLIEAGAAPNWAWDGDDGDAPKPSPDHKRGFSVMLYVKGQGWREWSANTAGSMNGLRAIWSEILPGIPQNPGMVVVLAYGGSTAMKLGKGTTRIPNFSLVKWIVDPAGERPKQASAPIVAAPPPAAAPAPKAAPSAHVPPPPPFVAPATQSSVGDAEF